MTQQFHVWIYNPKTEKRCSKILHTGVHSSIIHTSQKLETIRMSISDKMGKQKVRNPYMEYYSTIKRMKYL